MRRLDVHTRQMSRFALPGKEVSSQPCSPATGRALGGVSSGRGRRVSTGCRRQHGGIRFPLHRTELATHATSGSGYKGAGGPHCRAPPVCAEQAGGSGHGGAAGRTRPAESCTRVCGREQCQGGVALCADHLLGGGRRRQLERSLDRSRRDVLLQRGRRLVELGAAPGRATGRAAAHAAAHAAALAAALAASPLASTAFAAARAAAPLAAALSSGCGATVTARAAALAAALTAAALAATLTAATLTAAVATRLVPGSCHQNHYRDEGIGPGK